MKSMLIPFCLFAFTGCSTLLDHVDDFTCSYLPYYVADCLDPAVHDKAVNIITNGAIEAQINCTGPADSSFKQFYYSASKLQDGSCFATANITGYSGTAITGRSQVNADLCPVSVFDMNMLRTDLFVEAGVLRFVRDDATYTMNVEGNCTGLNIDKF